MKHATLRQLKVFEAVARHLSFSRAAEELHLTQPAVSTQVKKLEDRLDELESATAPAANLAMAVREGSPMNSPVLNRGELKEKGPEVPRGVLTVLKTPYRSPQADAFCERLMSAARVANASTS